MPVTLRIPFNKPSLEGNETAYIAEAVQNGHSAGGGPFTRKCEEFLANNLGTRKVLLTTSCTHALEMSAILVGIQHGDEVIVPSYTFVSTVNAFVLRGARPVFADINPATLNMDEEVFESLISERTKAVVPVHYAGVGCEMDRICDAAKRHGVTVIEDNAHGLFGKYKGEFLGTFGELATLSFHETKNIICGEGGALLINDETYLDRAEVLRDKGTNRSQFFRGQVDKYSWVDIGSSYTPSDILAAFLLAQLEAKDKILAKRKKVFDTYSRKLQGWAKATGVGLPVVPPSREQPYHMFYLLMPSLAHRQGLIKFLEDKGILSVFHYVPLHLSKMGRSFGYREGDLPVTENLSDRLVRLPFYNNLQEDEQDLVCSTIIDFQA